MNIIDDVNIVLIVLLVLPLIFIELGFKVYAIVDIHKYERRVRHLSKIAWTILIAFISFSWIVYLLIGREDAVIEDRESEQVL